MSDDEEETRQLGGRTKQPQETVTRIIQLGQRGDNLHDMIDILSAEKMKDSNGREFEANDKSVQGKLDVLRRILWSENIIVGTSFRLTDCNWWEDTLSKLETITSGTSQSPLTLQQIHQALHESGCKCSDNRAFPLESLWVKEVHVLLVTKELPFSKAVSKKRQREKHMPEFDVTQHIAQKTVDIFRSYGQHEVPLIFATHTAMCYLRDEGVVSKDSFLAAEQEFVREAYKQSCAK